MHGTFTSGWCLFVLLLASDLQYVTLSSSSTGQWCIKELSDDLACHCSGHLDILTTEFKRLNDQCRVNRKCHYDNLFLYQCPVSLLGEHLLGNLTFNSLLIYSAEELNSFELEKPVSECLNKQVFVNAPSKLKPVSVEQILSSSPELMQLELALTAHQSHTLLASSTIENGSQLRYLVYRANSYNISLIDDFAFSHLNELQVVKVANIPVKHIASRAFYLKQTKASNENLVINLCYCQLSDQLLALPILVSPNRPTHFLLEYNQITRISQSTFGSFLTQRSDNIVSLYENPLECEDRVQYNWLLSNKTRYRRQVWGALCSSGLRLFDLEPYFGKCTLTPQTKWLRCTNVTQGELDIRQELYYFEHNLDTIIDSLQRVTVSDCTLTQIKAYAFGTTSVKRIDLIRLENFEFIDPNTLADEQTSHLEEFNLIGSNKLSSITNLLDLINKCHNLRQLSLSFFSDIAIPSNAFHTSLQLRNISFLPSNYSIRIISSNIIENLILLQHVRFAGVQIKQIQSDAFRFATSTDRVLLVDLQQCRLSETTFNQYPFDNANRPLHLNLSDNFIQIIEKKCFGFVTKDTRNRVDLRNNPVKCHFKWSSVAQHPHFWIYKERSTLSEQLLNAHCTDVNQTLFEYLKQQFGDESGTGSAVRSSIPVVLLCTLLVANLYLA